MQWNSHHSAHLYHATIPNSTASRRLRLFGYIGHCLDEIFTLLAIFLGHLKKGPSVHITREFFSSSNIYIPPPQPANT